MTTARIPLLLLLAAAFLACAHGPRVPGGREPLAEGMASFYGPGFAGRLTASGERFDPREFTAAHRTLPFGSCVRVVDVKTGKEVKVRVTDRGPHVPGRVIDLSKAAAEKLGIVDQGVAQVRLYACR